VEGFVHVKRLDYQQVFAAVVRADTFRTLLPIATLLDWDISNVDIDSAFLHGNIDTEVYIELPEGFYPPNQCGKLKKSIYSLKQAPPIWAQTLYKILRDLGLTQLQSEHSLFTNLDDKRRKLQKHAGKPDEDFLGYHVGPEQSISTTY
jgi:hypothetical protein